MEQAVRNVDISSSAHSWEIVDNGASLPPRYSRKIRLQSSFERCCTTSLSDISEKEESFEGANEGSCWNFLRYHITGIAHKVKHAFRSLSFAYREPKNVGANVRHA